MNKLLAALIATFAVSFALAQGAAGPTTRTRAIARPRRR